MAAGNKREPDLEYVGLSSVGGIFPPAERTPFKDIRAELTPPPVDSKLATLSPGATITEGAVALRAALDRTLDRLLENAQCVAVQTGGGLDSGGLLALVDAWAKRSGRRFFAVAIDFEARGDDRPYLRALEEALRCRVIRLRPEEGARFVETAFRDGVDSSPLPYATAGFEIAAYSRAAAEGADCLLTGVGGDQLFDGIARSLSEVVWAEGPFAAWSAVRELRGFQRPRHPFATWIVRPLISGMVPRAIRSQLVRSPPLPSVAWAGPALRASLANERRRRKEDARRFVRWGRSPVSNWDRVFARHRQQMAQISRIPQRIDPYVDPSLKAFVQQLPAHWLLSGGIRRGLFREAVRDIIPAALYGRLTKGAFEPAMRTLLDAVGGFEFLRPFANVSALAKLGIIDPGPFRLEFERFAADPAYGPYWLRVWPVLALEAFTRHHFRDHVG